MAAGGQPRVSWWHKVSLRSSAPGQPSGCCRGTQPLRVCPGRRSRHPGHIFGASKRGSEGEVHTLDTSGTFEPSAPCPRGALAPKNSCPGCAEMRNHAAWKSPLNHRVHPQLLPSPARTGYGVKTNPHAPPAQNVSPELPRAVTVLTLGVLEQRFPRPGPWDASQSVPSSLTPSDTETEPRVQIPPGSELRQRLLLSRHAPKGCAPPAKMWNRRPYFQHQHYYYVFPPVNQTLFLPASSVLWDTLSKRFSIRPLYYFLFSVMKNSDNAFVLK